MLIGVFHPHDPFAVTPSRRIQALCEEANQQEVQLVFFNEEGIDLEHQMVTGKVPSEAAFQPDLRGQTGS